MSSNDTTEVTHIDLHPVGVVGWFNVHTDLRSVHPHVATESDAWGVFGDDDDELVALALVEGGELHRLGVRESHRRERLASAIVDVLHEEYGTLEASCRESLDANDFYDATGWERVRTDPGSPEPLVVWEYDPDE